MHQFKIPAALLWMLFISYFLLFLLIQAQDYSALSPYVTSCCNKFGYYGVGDDYCGADCVASCNYRPECNVSNPYAMGCCNKFGYCGLGPDCTYALASEDNVNWDHIDCAKDVCVASCDSRAKCNLGGYGEFTDSAKCLLNVYYSKFGFCSTTKEFYSTKKVKRPSCSKNSGLSHVIGYYEG
jgi:hypothetical protein